MKENKVSWEDPYNIPRTMRDLSRLVQLADVKRALQFHYPDQKGLRKKADDVLFKIKTCKKMTPEKAGKLTIRCVGLSPFVSTKDDMYDAGYSISDVRRKMPWSLSFRSWTELSNIPIEKETLMRYTMEEILAHFIWEITWYGSERDSLEMGKKIMSDADKAIEEIKKKKRDNLDKGKYGVN